MQGSEVELGGFKGRTNKLVDGCYSWWVGGAFGLLEALGIGHGEGQGPHGDAPASGEDAENWDDVDGTFFSSRVLHLFTYRLHQYLPF
jgi:protein farnesyltransferase subunit beta